MVTNKNKVTFVLPGRNRSGGVRVTVIMANQLRRLGYDTRIVYRVNRPLTLLWTRSVLKEFINRSRYELQRIDWLHQFEGMIEQFVDIQKLKFVPGEVVIAVGIYTIQDVRKLDDSVIKVRYNHGFSVGVDELTRLAWGGSMPTIAVASTLVPRLEALSGNRVLGVIPNGLDPNEYFVESAAQRDGIGIMYSSHPNKCPHDIIRLMQRVSVELPHIPRYCFGGEQRPPDFRDVSYVRYPSVQQARNTYNRCMVWLSASREEGFCLPVLEAMACGCAVVSADNLGVRELIRDGENGFIVPLGNIDAFLSKIKCLREDTQLRQRFVSRGLETSESFGWEKAAQAMDGFLQRIQTSERNLCVGIG